jgi:hypothetical protein
VCANVLNHEVTSSKLAQGMTVFVGINNSSSPLQVLANKQQTSLIGRGWMDSFYFLYIICIIIYIYIIYMRKIKLMIGAYRAKNLLQVQNIMHAMHCKLDVFKITLSLMITITSLCLRKRNNK